MSVQYEERDGCAILTLDRPDARNAVDGNVARELEAGLDRAESGDARVAVLAGAPGIFCAGADLKEISAGRAAALSTERGGFAGMVRRKRRIPLIAAVDGPALAGGMELVLACDLVVASEAARFGIPEVKRGLVAGGGGAFRIARVLPMNVAMECALTGDPIDAATAHRHGLVNVLCAPGQALDQALTLARRIIANAPLAVHETRALVLEGTRATDAEAWQQTRRASETVLASDDVREGVAAFIEKREPVWAGR